MRLCDASERYIVYVEILAEIKVSKIRILWRFLLLHIQVTFLIVICDD